MALSKFTKSMIGLLPAVSENPPIPFISKKRKLDNPEESADKTEFIRLVFLWTSTTQLLSMQGVLSYSRMDAQKTG